MEDKILDKIIEYSRELGKVEYKICEHIGCVDEYGNERPASVSARKDLENEECKLKSKIGVLKEILFEI